MRCGFKDSAPEAWMTLYQEMRFGPPLHGHAYSMQGPHPTRQRHESSVIIRPQLPRTPLPLLPSCWSRSGTS